MQRIESQRLVLKFLKGIGAPMASIKSPQSSSNSLSPFSLAFIFALTMGPSHKAFANTKNEVSSCQDLVALTTETALRPRSLQEEGRPKNKPEMNPDSRVTHDPTDDPIEQEYHVPTLKDFAFYAHDDHLYRMILVEQFGLRNSKFTQDFQEFTEKYFHIISVTERQNLVSKLSFATTTYMTSLATHSDLVREANKSKKIKSSQVQKIHAAREILDRDRAALKSVYADLAKLSEKDSSHFKVVSVWIKIIEKHLAQIANLEREIREHFQKIPKPTSGGSQIEISHDENSHNKITSIASMTGEVTLEMTRENTKLNRPQNLENQNSPEALKWRSLGAHLLSESSKLKSQLDTIRINLRARDASAESFQKLMMAAKDALEMAQYEFLAPAPEKTDFSGETALAVQNKPPLVDRLGLRPFFEKVGWVNPQVVPVRQIDLDLSPAGVFRVHDALPEQPQVGDSVLIGDRFEGRDQWPDRENSNLRPENLRFWRLYRQKIVRSTIHPWSGEREIFYKNAKDKNVKVKDSDLVVFDLKGSSSEFAHARFFLPIGDGRSSGGEPNRGSINEAGTPFVPVGISYDGKSVFLATEDPTRTSGLVELSIESLQKIVSRTKAIEKRSSWYAKVNRILLGDVSAQPVEWSLYDLQGPRSVDESTVVFSIRERELVFTVRRLKESEASSNYDSDFLLWSRPDILWQGFRVGDVVFNKTRPAFEANDVSPIYRLQDRSYAEVMGFTRNGDVVVHMREAGNSLAAKVQYMKPRNLAQYGGLPETSEGRRALTNTLESPAYGSVFSELSLLDFHSEEEFDRYKRYYAKSKSLPVLTDEQLRSRFHGSNLIGQKVKMLNYQSTASFDQVKHKSFVSVQVVDDFDATVTGHIADDLYVLNGHENFRSKDLFLIGDRGFLFGGLRIGDLLILGDRSRSDGLKDLEVIGFNHNSEVLMKDKAGRYFVERLSFIRHYLRSPFPEDRRQMLPPNDF